jgi:hypothetical protein
MRDWCIPIYEDRIAQIKRVVNTRTVAGRCIHALVVMAVQGEQ